MVAVYSSRPALAIVVFLITLAAWRATVEALVSAGYDIAALAAIPDHPGYVKDWIMGANSEAWLPETAGYGPFLSLVVIMAIGAIAAVAVVRRYRSEL
jgi:hypothetical protein